MGFRIFAVLFLSAMILNASKSTTATNVTSSETSPILTTKGTSQDLSSTRPSTQEISYSVSTIPSTKAKTQKVLSILSTTPSTKALTQGISSTLSTIFKTANPRTSVILTSIPSTNETTQSISSTLSSMQSSKSTKQDITNILSSTETSQKISSTQSSISSISSISPSKGTNQPNSSALSSLSSTFFNKETSQGQSIVSTIWPVSSSGTSQVGRSTPSLYSSTGTSKSDTLSSLSSSKETSQNLGSTMSSTFFTKETTKGQSVVSTIWPISSSGTSQVSGNTQSSLHFSTGTSKSDTLSSASSTKETSHDISSTLSYGSTTKGTSQGQGIRSTLSSLSPSIGTNQHTSSTSQSISSSKETSHTYEISYTSSPFSTTEGTSQGQDLGSTMSPTSADSNKSQTTSILTTKEATTVGINGLVTLTILDVTQYNETAFKQGLAKVWNTNCNKAQSCQNITMDDIVIVKSPLKLSVNIEIYVTAGEIVFYIRSNKTNERIDASIVETFVQNNAESIAKETNTQIALPWITLQTTESGQTTKGLETISVGFENPKRITIAAFQEGFRKVYNRYCSEAKTTCSVPSIQDSDIHITGVPTKENNFHISFYVSVGGKQLDNEHVKKFMTDRRFFLEQTLGTRLVLSWIQTIPQTTPQPTAWRPWVIAVIATIAVLLFLFIILVIISLRRDQKKMTYMKRELSERAMLATNEDAESTIKYGTESDPAYYSNETQTLATFSVSGAEQAESRNTDSTVHETTMIYENEAFIHDDSSTTRL